MKPFRLWLGCLFPPALLGASLSNKEFTLQDADQVVGKFPYKVELLESQVGLSIYSCTQEVPLSVCHFRGETLRLMGCVGSTLPGTQ